MGADKKEIKITYLGYNNMYKHKRGVENVIDIQSQAYAESFHYYIHWDTSTKVYRYNNLLCIGVKKDAITWILALNSILNKINRRDGQILIHSHNPLMSVVSKFRTDLFTVHDGLYYLAKSINHKFRYVFYVLEKFMYKRSKMIHFISNYSKSKSLFSLKSKKFVVIPNTSHYEIIASKYLQSRKVSESFFKEDKFKIFIVRSIEERARIDLIIETALALVDENIEILIGGKGPLLDHYKQKIEDLKLTNIHLLGYVSDEKLLMLYSQCDLVIMPAEFGEGFGLPMIEGYLFDKPVIASNKCAIPEFIFSDDYLFENNVESILQKIKFVKNGKKDNYKDYYEKRFSNKINIGEMIKLYNSL
ncbi:glycosyltransferase [Flavobacterium sp. 245]|uniref:glycosyltransferase n=1 Tax=Flavobacterium sp. 245 TaxID=2512115 RepID=UPI00105E4F8C|nr:glycosyltransferase [Flavobacterium sp. 245]TDP00905.1 glycosyl transferase family 1 [Flavobacterium sp. 245]